MESINELFSEEELKILNFSDDEIESLLDADALAKTADLLPEEPDDVLNRIDREFPDDVKGSIDKMTELAKKDPAFLKKLIALNEVVGEVRNDNPASQKVTSSEIKKQLLKEDIEKIKKILSK